VSSSSSPRRPLRAGSYAAVLALSLAGVTVVASPAHAADPVDIQLLNINDFHGRIDANTTKFATTVENLRAANPNTLFLSAGDNIGASLFASNVQQDAPTIDVLNALGLQTSAVGNHEFDKGAADLTGRVNDRAAWSYLGANVYTKGTTTPALPEYDTFEVGGVTVGVIGVVTQETATAVSPGGIANLDFGDPVVAVNRVAGQLTDSNPANGEADVIVAEYHEGADGGEPGSTLAAEVARNGGATAFADIVNDTAASVDVIFTGHTHSAYAWDAPVPGSSSTRPIVQTGSYGANIGQVELTYDPDTDEVTAYTGANVARVATANESLPKVAQVKTIVDAALAQAAKVGNQVVGSQTGDITTAFTGGSYVNGRYAGGTRDDRASESTLGNLVAQALLAPPAASSADFSVTNPGGLRAELIAAGNTAGSPANTDGVITLAEAASVLTFANTLSLVEMTGAEIDLLFEQQWPTSDRRTQLKLSASDNLRLTVDPTRAAGDRVTSIRLDGELIDPAATYTVSTLTFLAAGGDGFSAFTQGEATDIGLLDLDVFIDYLRANSPVSPDFARQQVQVTGTVPDTIAAGDVVNVGLGGLDLTSQSSPLNTEVLAFAVSGNGYRQLGSFPVVQGNAQVSFTVPADLAGQQGLALLAEPSRTLVGADLPQLASTTTATVPARVTSGGSYTVPVTVAAPLSPRGSVQLLDGNRVVGRANVVDGKATIALTGRELAVGTHQLRVAYQGDGLVAASTSAVAPVTVVAPPRLSLAVAVQPKRIVAKRTRPFVKVALGIPAGRTAGGPVVVATGGRTYRANLVNGKATLRLRTFKHRGWKKVRANYWDAARGEVVTKTVTVWVRRAR
jgi:5'-nucleotidase